MKSKLACIVLMAVLLTAVNSFAGGLTQCFTWLQYSDDFDTDPTTIGTAIHVGTATGVYDFKENGGINTTQACIANFDCEQTYFVTATHYRPIANTEAELESESAPEVTFTTPPCAYVKFRPMTILPEVKKLHIPKGYGRK